MRGHAREAPPTVRAATLVRLRRFRTVVTAAEAIPPVAADPT
jgi:hypothetical protein